MPKCFVVFFLNIGIFNLFSQEIFMNGIILDAETKEPIEYVNIGILNKNQGTVSDLEGKFKFQISNEFKNDSLTISHVIYNTLKIPIQNFKNKTIYLTPNQNQLKEVVISNTKKKQRKIGVKTYNPLLWLGAVSKKMDIIENAQLIQIPNKTVRVKAVNMYLRRGFEADSSHIRINFYKNVDNRPDEKIVFQNILKKLKIEPGWITIDLSKEYIYLEEDFFIGIEFMPDFKKPMDVYLGVILTKGKGFSRQNSQGTWNAIDGASTINVEVEY
jgi:hypothetical protein